MAGNSFGALFKITTFGESHGAALGVVIDGCPAGVPILRDNIQAALNRRRPGIQDGVLNVAVTARSEPDTVEILSGVFEDKSTGTPIALVIRNTSQNSKDYGNLQYVFRPGHGDFTYQQKYGVRDFRGGGRASGRETAARVAAGAVAQSVLKHFLGNDISVVAYTKRAAGISCNSVDFSVIEKNSLRAADLEAAALMEHEVQRLRQDGDSAGGVVECCVSGVPAGLGEPVFDKLDAVLAQALLSIGAVKGIEFGLGFDFADKTGSTANDEMYVRENQVDFKTNNAGGILAGISTGNDIVFRIAVKPVPSIYKKQKTVAYNENGFEDTDLEIEGRHDVCLCPRIVPVVEAMTWLVLTDMYLRQKSVK